MAMVIAGLRVGRLTTVSDAGRANDGHKLWLCKCDCGNECIRQSNNLHTNGLASCGCAQSDVHKTHGMKYSREYQSWNQAKQRCYNAMDKHFLNYGGRGISMCDEWRNSFELFFSDMGNMPIGLTLDRINVNRNYEPGNCRWATYSEQNRNRRNSVWIQWKGNLRHLCDVAEELGITYGAAFMRFKRGKLNEGT